MFSSVLWDVNVCANFFSKNSYALIKEIEEGCNSSLIFFSSEKKYIKLILLPIAKKCKKNL